MNFNYYRLWLSIKLLRKIPSSLKIVILKNLIKEEISFGGWRSEESKKSKNLFYTGMFYRAYDIFTTSIYALLLGNEISLCTLIRLQLENYVLTSYILKNPNDLKNIFDIKIEFGKALKSLENKAHYGKIWGLLSEKTHSFPEGLKSCYANMNILNHKTMKFEPCLALKSHHGRINDEDRELLFKYIVEYYWAVKNNLEKIKGLNINFEIESYDKIHQKSQK